MDEYFEEDIINNVQKISDAEEPWISDAEEPCPICLETFYEK